jgi:hypothetical protein
MNQNKSKLNMDEIVSHGVGMWSSHVQFGALGNPCSRDFVGGS